MVNRSRFARSRPLAIHDAAMPAAQLVARFRLWLVLGCVALALVPPLREPSAWFGSPWLVLVAAPLAGLIMADANAALRMARRPLRALRQLAGPRTGAVRRAQARSRR